MVESRPRVNDERPYFASASLEVSLPYGRRISKLDVTATADEGRWDQNFESRTDELGVALFDLVFPERPPIRSPDYVWLVFHAIWEDSDRGLTWSGRCEGGTSKLSREADPKPKRTQMVLTRDSDEGFWVKLADETSLKLLSQKRGEDLLYNFEELSDCIHHALPTAALNMAGRVLDDAIWLRGRQQGWPMDSWGDRPTLGVLADKPEVTKDIDEYCGRGFRSRLKALAVTIRNLAAHQKQSTVSLDDAKAARTALKQLVEAWWPGGATDHSPHPRG